MWLFLWIVVSAIVLGASAWSLRILLKQKAAWEIFAKEKSFAFNKGSFMGPAEMSGVIGDYKLSFFTAERTTTDIRGKRYVTVLEVDVSEGMVDGGVFGTQEMLSFMQTLDRLHPLNVDFVPWEPGLFAFVREDEPVRAYLTPERADVVQQILKTRNADAIIIFNDKEIVVRMETSDPMQDPQKIDKIVKRMLDLIGKLRLKKDEREALLASIQ